VGSTDTDKHHNTSAASQQTNKTDLITAGDTFRSFSLVADFFDTVIQVTELLQLLNPEIIADHCGLLRASEQANIPLFTTSFTNAIKDTKVLQ